MATMTCESCQIGFEGRPNRKYCSAVCRRKAEMKERERKKKERRKAWKANLTPEERAAWGEPTDWGEPIEWDLPPSDWGEPTDWGGTPEQ